MRHATMQTMHAGRGFGVRRDPEGAEVLFHRAPHRDARRHACADASAPIV